MNILQAIEKLSAASTEKKQAENAAAETEEIPAQNAESPKAQPQRGDLRLTESLLSRHERTVYRIKNGKK